MKHSSWSDHRLSDQIQYLFAFLKFSFEKRKHDEADCCESCILDCLSCIRAWMKVMFLLETMVLSVVYHLCLSENVWFHKLFVFVFNKSICKCNQLYQLCISLSIISHMFAFSWQFCVQTHLEFEIFNV